MTQSLGKESYEQFADRYAAVVETKAHNAYLANPAIRSLLPPLAGCRVLDAGCGSGHFSDEFLNAGAEVVAFDVTPRFVEITRERLGDRATVYQHDLIQPLDFAEDASFDLVFSNLVMDYSPDWTPILTEFARVLRPGGAALWSFGHPAAEWALVKADRLVVVGEEPDYFAVQMTEMDWGGFGEPRPVVRAYRRPLQAGIASMLAAGLTLDALLEMQPTPEFAEVDSDRYARFMRNPTFMCIRAVKPA